MTFFEDLEKSSVDNSVPRWTGTFREFLRLFETKEYPNLGVLAHQRVYNMVLDPGTEKKDHFGTKRTSYPFFENDLYGMEESIDQIMTYLHSAAQKTETSRRMLLLYGPPSSAKTDLVVHIKRGLERYSKTKQGAIFALAKSQMHENPFLLVPHDKRDEFHKAYGIKIEGELSPPSRYYLDNNLHGNFMDYPVEQIFLSEALRVGIGTCAPSDPKSTDTAELVGGIDFARIQEVGDEADPRAYNFNGEMNVANRGVMDFIELLKTEEKFLRVLLTATEEKAIKSPRFGLIYTDIFIIGHSNETEFRNFMGEKKYEPYHDRMVVIRVPYNLSVSNEIKIYQKLLDKSDNGDMHIAPNTLVAAAMVAVLSRLDPTESGELTLIKKMKLYDNKNVPGFKLQEVPDIKKRHPREGMTGMSPRFVIDQISAAISKARDEGRNYITALDVLRQLNSAIFYRDTFTPEQKNNFVSMLEQSRREWNDILRNDIQKAFYLSYDEDAKSLCRNYLEQIQLACSGDKPRDPITHEFVELDEKLMRSIEDKIEISTSGREDFRNEILRAVAQASLVGKTFDYTEHAYLSDAIQKKLFEERQGVIRMTTTTRNPDKEELKRINEVVGRMVEKQNYSVESANALLKYASAHLFDK